MSVTVAVSSLTNLIHAVRIVDLPDLYAVSRLAALRARLNRAKARCHPGRSPPHGPQGGGTWRSGRGRAVRRRSALAVTTRLQGTRNRVPPAMVPAPRFDLGDARHHVAAHAPSAACCGPDTFLPVNPMVPHRRRTEGITTSADWTSSGCLYPSATVDWRLPHTDPSEAP